ncbi:hypothetical protein [Rubidibacter lacunae]|nr:hypothetical protein [Rubidibacter lacunae]
MLYRVPIAQRRPAIEQCQSLEAAIPRTVWTNYTRSPHKLIQRDRPA